MSSLCALGGALIELAKGPQSQNKVQAAHISRIVLNGVAFIHVLVKSFCAKIGR